MPVIVLISGYAGSGKDTFAGFLIKHLSGAQKYAFADPIKEIARKYFEWDGIKDERGRKLLIEIGAAGMEENLYIWAERVIERIMEEQSKTAVITDWRFKHEYQRIKKAFGNKNIVTIRIERERLNIIDDIVILSMPSFLFFQIPFMMFANLPKHIINISYIHIMHQYICVLYIGVKSKFL
jgi:hypothetical protein